MRFTMVLRAVQGSIIVYWQISVSSMVTCVQLASAARMGELSLAFTLGYIANAERGYAE